MKNNPVFFGSFRQKVYNNSRVTKEAMMANPENYLCVSKASRYPVFEIYAKRKPVNIIYSQWEGYLKLSNEEYYGAEQIAACRNNPNYNFIVAHTSGHAPVEDLKRFAEAMNPYQIVQIHSEARGIFKEMFRQTLMLSDSEEINI